MIPPFKGRYAFTLIEIIITVSIIALLIFIPFFAFGRTLANARDNERKDSAARIQGALEQYKSELGNYPDSLTDLVDEGYLPVIPEDPFEGQEVPGSNGELFYGFDENYSTENGNQWYTLIVPLEEEETIVLSGGEEEQRKKVIVYTPEGPMLTGIPEGGRIPTSTPRPSYTTIPTSNFSPTPTATDTPTPTPLPLCNQGISCSGSCQQLSGRCGSYASTQTGCTYTTHSSGGSCTQPAQFSQSCTVSGQTCAGNLVCSGTNCVTPSNTPTPTPRRCWGTNGNCDTACTIVTGGSSWSGYYTSCSGPTACWYTGSTKCVTNVNSTANKYVQKYLNSASCSANGIGFRWSGADDCSTNGTGACYLFNATCDGYTFTSDGNMYERNVPANTCTGPYGYLAGGVTFACQGTIQQCTWGVSGACGTNQSGLVNQPNVADIGNCSTDGSGTCRKAVGSPLTNSGYDPTTSASSCNPLPRYDVNNLQTCTWYEN